MDDAKDRGGLYATTQWSLVVAAGDSRHPDAHEALAALCQAYWYPVYAQMRYRGRDSETRMTSEYICDQPLILDCRR